MDDLNYFFDKFKAETAIPSIVLTTERKDNIAITDSKLGGNPYLPKDFKYPTTLKGENLKLLAQLNFAQLPKLENFPSEGILQFYILPDDQMGLSDYSESTNPNTYRVIYHEKILPDEMLMKDFSEIIVQDMLYDPWFPFEGEFLIKGTVENCPINYETYEFEEAFARFCKDNNIESHFEAYLADFQETKRNMTESEFKEFHRKYREQRDLIDESIGFEEGHRISGYPYFLQGDLRHYEQFNLKKYNTLLLQIVSEQNEKNNYGIMWGDCGVANFFINLEDLKARNFKDVLYTWDCY